jgi:hypothetical protein
MDTKARSAPVSEESEALCTRIVEAVAAVEGVDPRELTPPLYEVIDPDALEQLVDTSSAPVTVEFDYGRWRVTLDDNVVSIAPRIDPKPN